VENLQSAADFRVSPIGRVAIQVAQTEEQHAQDSRGVPFAVVGCAPGEAAQ
jgi:hypothetical protein